MGENYTLYLSQRNPIRKFVRSFYLKDISKLCVGKTIDFGCGIGELLSFLPEGSRGVDINKSTVEYCRSVGMNVEHFVPEEDRYDLKLMNSGEFDTFTANHVFEHVEHAADTMKLVFESCRKKGIKRIVLTFPGIKGYQGDLSHRTFIDMEYIRENMLVKPSGFHIVKAYYFPVNNYSLSKYFRHNELRVVYDSR